MTYSIEDETEYSNPVVPYLYPETTDIMTLEEQLEAIAAAQKGDKKAMERLLVQFERLCHKLARKFAFTGPNQDHEDLVQEARVGAIKAVMSFDPDNGAKPITWLYYAIRGQVVSAGRTDRKQPSYPYSIEDCPRAYNVEDPSQEVDVKDDLPRRLVERLIEQCCGGMHTKRAKIVMDRYGLLGRKELRNCECAEKYGITKYAVTSHTSGFKRKARIVFPELAQFV